MSSVRVGKKFGLMKLTKTAKNKILVRMKESKISRKVARLKFLKMEQFKINKKLDLLAKERTEAINLLN